MSLKGTTDINRYASYVIFLTCALLVSCAQDTDSKQYKLTTYSKNGEISSAGIIYLPSKLNTQYLGDCKWKENNAEITPCYVEISKAVIYINLDPSWNDANRMLSGNIKNNSAKGVTEYQSYGGTQRTGTFELTNE